MPKIRPGMKRPPLGFDVVNDALDAFELDMRSVMHTAPLARGKPVMVHGERGAKRSRVSNEELKAPELGAPHLDEDAAQQRSPSGGDSAPMVETDGCAGGDGAGGPVGAAPAEHVGGEWDDIEACPAVAPAEVIAGHAANPFAAVVERVPPLWMVAHINRERTRYVYDMHYKSKQISKEVLDYCCEMNFIDAGLVRRWRVPGYEKLCCVNCAAPGVASTLTSSSSSRAVHARKQQRHEEHQHRPGRGGLESATCICRVPLAQRRQGLVACLVCGCSGCCSGDRAEGPTPTPPARERSLAQRRMRRDWCSGGDHVVHPGPLETWTTAPPVLTAGVHLGKHTNVLACTRQAYFHIAQHDHTHDHGLVPGQNEAHLLRLCIMTSIFDTLGVAPPQGVLEPQHTSRRIVIVGNAMSGKRTIAMNLRAAAQQQQQLFSSCSAMGGGIAPGFGFVGPGDGSSDMSALPGTNSAAAALQSATFSRSSSTKTRGGGRPSLLGTSASGSALAPNGVSAEGLDTVHCHGAGVSHTHVQQRLPASYISSLRLLPHSATTGGGKAGGRSSNITELCDSAQALTMASSGPPTAGQSFSGPVRKLTTELFCCDTPDALWAALPTLEAIETSAVLFVVDLAEAERMKEQLRYWSVAVHEHVITILRLFVPKHDEVRRMKMVERQQRFWQYREGALRELALGKWKEFCQRERHTEESGTPAHGGEAPVFPPPGATSNDSVPQGDSAPPPSPAARSLPIRSGAEMVCPMHSVVVFNKFDLLERAVKEVTSTLESAAARDLSGSTGPTPRAASKPPLMQQLQQQNISELQRLLSMANRQLMPLTTQFFRKEAILMGSALVSLGSRVSFVGAVGRRGAPGVLPPKSTAGVHGDGSSSSRMYPSTFPSTGVRQDDGLLAVATGGGSANEAPASIAPSDTNLDAERSIRALPTRPPGLAPFSRVGRGGEASVAGSVTDGVMTTLVHPVYKALWSYLFHLLYCPTVVPESALPSRRASAILGSPGAQPADEEVPASPPATGDTGDSERSSQNNVESHSPGQSPTSHSPLLRSVASIGSGLVRPVPLPEEIEGALTFTVGQQGFLPHGVDSLTLLDRLVVLDAPVASVASSTPYPAQKVTSPVSPSLYHQLFRMRRQVVNQLLGIREDFVSPWGVEHDEKSFISTKTGAGADLDALRAVGVRMHASYLDEITGILDNMRRDIAAVSMPVAARATPEEQCTADQMIWDDLV